MSRLRSFGFVSTVAGAVLMLGGLAASAQADSDHDHGVPHEKVTICHATAAETNPYISENVSVRSADGRYTTDHSHHLGPIWYEGAKDDDVEWGDIIPPLYDGDAGLNWTTEGRAIWANGCTIPVPTTTTVIDTTTTVIDTTTTVIDTTTTVEEVTTTSIESGGPTTTVTPNTLAPTTTVGGESGGPTTTTSVMPSTGAGQQSLLLAGLVMVGIGVLARLIGRRGANA